MLTCLRVLLVWLVESLCVCTEVGTRSTWPRAGRPFLPYASAHARRSTVLRNSLIGLLHRMHMDTQPKDVPLLLPVLLAYYVELHTLQYPSHSLLNAFEKFLHHTKVSQGTNSHLWYDLYRSFGQQKRFAAA